MKIAFNPSTVAALTTPPNNKDITFDLRGHSIFARGVEFKGTDTNTWRDIKINNVSIGSHTLDLRNGSNTTLTNTNGVVTINSTWRPVVDNLTSDSTTSSLSAKQGKVLKALIDGKSNSDHNHDGRYAISENYGGFKKSGRLPISGFYQSDESESGGNAPWSNWMHLINCQHNNTDNNYALQIAASFFDNNTFKIRVTNNNVNNSWRNIIHSGNISSQSVNYANSAGNADTVDGAHLSDIKNWSDRTASAYWKAGWYKVASAQTATNTEAFLTLDVNAAQSNGHATLFIRKRADSKPYFICTYNNNLNLADFRLYYNGMSMVLYARVPNDWHGRVFRIISEGREGTYDHIWTLYSNVSSTDPNAISAEGGNPYINPTYSGRVDWSNSSDKANYANSAGSVAWANVTGKPSSYTPSAHTHAWNSLTHSSTTENQAILTNGKANGWKLQTLNIARWDNAANNAHSHANKSVLDGITSTLVNSWNTAYNFVSNITGTDTDKVINKWEEIVNFLAGITEDNKLNTLLNSKLSVYELADKTNVGTIKNNGIYYSTTDASSSTLTNSPFNNGFTLINMTSYDGGDDLRRSRLAFNAFGEIKVSDDRDQANTAETWYNVLTSKNSGINGSTIKLNGTSITVYSSGTADGRYVKKSGDTMSGVLTIDTTNFGALTIKRNDDANGASIQFRGKSSVYGYIGLNNSTKDKQFLRWSSDISRIYTILDTSSTYISNGKGVINGTTITQVDNATNSTNSTNARKLVNWYSARPTSLNAQFGDGSLRIFYATSSTTEGKPAEDSHILHLAWDNTGGYDAQLAVHTHSGKVSTRAQNGGTWQPWKTLAFTTDIPSSLKNPYSFNVFGVVYDGSAAKTVTTSNFISQVNEDTSTITDGTMLITSYATNSGFADTNAVNVPYKRKAIHLWEYIKAKTDSLYATKGHNHDGRYLRLSGQDTMQGNLYLHSYGPSYIGKGLGDKSGADFTEANIVIRSWWGISFKSYDDIVRTYIDTRTGNIGTKGVLNAVGAVIQGRIYNGGDDEGIIINPAPNGYAGLILGTHNGERSVFYLRKGNPFWRYNNGSTNLDIYHPKKSGTIALTSDIPNKDSWNYDDRYLRLTGGWMSGNIYFKVDNSYDIGSNDAASRYIYTNWLGARSGRKLELGANNSGFGQGLCIDTNLNVGIGTNTPTQKLDVVGNIRATGQLYLPTNGNYNAILMGNDCWMGDCNISNVIGLSGTNNANSGGIKFGKGGMYIGYNGSSHYSSGTSLWSNFNADLLDGYHENSFLRYRGATYIDQEATLWSQIGIKQYNDVLPDNLTGVYNYGSVISLPGFNSRFEIYASHQSSNGNGLYYRSGWGNDKKAWLKFIDSSNIGRQSVNYANSAGHANSAGNADTLGGIPRNYGQAPFGTIPSIGNDGVMEIGKYIDFHFDNSGSYDYSTRIYVTSNYKNIVSLPSASGTLALTSYGGDTITPVFLGYLNLYRGGGSDTNEGYSYCLGQSTRFTYTIGGNYCRIVIPDTKHRVFCIEAAIASVNYSGVGMYTQVGEHRGKGAWWLHCEAFGWNEVHVQGFCLANSYNGSWWCGNPLYSGDGGAGKITVCIFGHVKYK